MPKPLQPGDTVRIIAPSGLFDRDKFDRGVGLLAAQELKPVWDEGLFSTERYLAGTDERRATELLAALRDEAAAAVWVARGGYGLTRILPQVPDDVWSGFDKWLIGFSDVTAAHARLSAHGRISLHGPNITTLGQWGDGARQATWDILYKGEAAPLTGRTMQGSGTVSGPLAGGNLTVLAAMVGTGMLPDYSGRIVLLEDVGEKPYRIDRTLTQMRQAGIFDRAAGFVLGQWSGCDHNDVCAEDIAVEGLAPLGVPILAGVPVGHDNDSFPAVLGAQATLDLSAGTLSTARV